MAQEGVEQKIDEDYDYCYECTAYGDEVSFDEDGEIICNCINCIHNQIEEWKDD